MQEQRDQYLSHLQQYTAGYQQLVAEREHLHKQFLHQAQLMDRLQHDEVQGKVQLEQSQIQLQEAQVNTVTLSLVFTPRTISILPSTQAQAFTAVLFPVTLNA